MGKKKKVKKSRGKLLIRETSSHQRGFYGKISLKIKILKYFVGKHLVNRPTFNHCSLGFFPPVGEKEMIDSKCLWRRGELSHLPVQSSYRPSSLLRNQPLRNLILSVRVNLLLKKLLCFRVLRFQKNSTQRKSVCKIRLVRTFYIISTSLEHVSSRISVLTVVDWLHVLFTI